MPRSEDALERYGFSDYQQWGDMFGAPLQGAQLDGTAAFETVDWLEHKAPTARPAWLLVCSLVNPHDVMFFQTDPVEKPHPERPMRGMQTTVQRLGWFEQQWDVRAARQLRRRLQAPAARVQHYKENIDLNYGRARRPRRPLAQAPQLPDQLQY